MDGEIALHLAMSINLNLIVLDIMLPKLNGYEICRRIREAGLGTPIIMLTAKGQEEDIIRGLNIGADDYVCKPFSIKELLARANALIRRTAGRKEISHQFGELTLHMNPQQPTYIKTLRDIGYRFEIPLRN